MELLKKIGSFLLDKIIDILALTIASFSLIISLQGTIADIIVSNELPKENIASIQGCKDQSQKYYVWLLFQKNFEFSNAGGGKASLNRVRLLDSDGREYATNLYQTSSNYSSPSPIDSTPFVLPLDIETSRTWFVTATHTYAEFNTEQEALSQIKLLLDMQPKLTWVFDFSNQQKIQLEEMVNSITPPQIDFNQSACH